MRIVACSVSAAPARAWPRSHRDTTTVWPGPRSGRLPGPVVAPGASQGRSSLRAPATTPPGRRLGSRSVGEPAGHLEQARDRAAVLLEPPGDRLDERPRAGPFAVKIQLGREAIEPAADLVARVPQLVV